MIRAVEASLRRLRTDHVDLFLLHTWDRITPVEEVLRTFDDLTRAGKIRYAGLSDVPAWYAARAQTHAEAHSLVPLMSLQLPYSLVERTIEDEHVAMGQTLGLGITAWSPLGGGFLTGKYRRAEQGPGGPGLSGEGRLGTGAPSGLSLGEREWKLLETLQVAVNWVATQPGIASAIVGASRPEQLDANVAALDFELPAELRARLDAASAAPPRSVYRMFTPEYQSWVVSPGAKVGDKPAGYAPSVRNWAPSAGAETGPGVGPAAGTGAGAGAGAETGPGPGPGAGAGAGAVV